MSDQPAVPATSGVSTVFIGSGAFAVPVLEALVVAPEVRLAAVVTAPSRPAGRGERLRRSPIAERASALGIVPILEPLRLRAPSVVAEIEALRPGLLVLADYGQMVPRVLLDLPAHGALNLHPSLLPRHRGASPVPATILAGDRQTGVTLMLMDEGLDTGPVVAQVAVPLGGDETAPELEALLAAEGAELLRTVLGEWLGGRRAARAQSPEGATMTHPLRREDGRLDPSRDAVQLERQVRAYQPWPGTWAESVAGRLIVWEARPLTLGSTTGGDVPASGTGAPAPGADGPAPGTSAAPPHAGPTLGLIVPDDDGLAVLVADGALRIEEAQLAGARRMTAAELRRGHPELVGSRLGAPALP